MCGCVGVWVRGCVGVWVCGCGCVCVGVCFFSYTPFLCAEKFRARLVILMMTALREGTLLPLAQLESMLLHKKFKRLRKLL